MGFIHKFFPARVNTPSESKEAGVSTPNPPPPPKLEMPPSTLSSRKPDEESAYRGLLQNLYDAAVITDLEGRITNANVRALDFLLYTRVELCNMQIVNIISGADRSLLQTIHRNLENQRFTNIEGYCIRKDGSIFPSEIVANRLQAASEDRLCFFIRDITKRKLVEEELSRSEARNRALLNAIPDLMLRLSKDGVLLDYKATVLEDPMVPSSALLGQPLSKVYPQLANEFMRQMQRALKESDTQVFEHQLQTESETRYYEIRIVLTEANEVLAIIRDITERKQAEKAEKERLDRDLEIAREIQQHLLPASFPKIEGAQVGAMNVAAMKVGGDYYDFIEVDPNHIGFAIADVSGKGIPGALIMAMCRSALRTKAAGILSPAKVLKEVNRVIHPDMREDMFISMIYGVMDIRTREFVFCRAGHEPLLLYRHQTGKEELLSPKGMALGIDNGTAFDKLLEEKSVKLQHRDAMVLYTDGITEAFDESGREFGRSQLIEAIHSCATQSAEEMARSIEQRVRRFMGDHPQSDDITLMVIRV